MRAVTLALFDTKRLLRHRWLWAVLCGIPLAAACALAIFAHSQRLLACAWACPFAGIVLTCAVLWAQRAVDHNSGLAAGLVASPLSESALIGSRVMTGLIVYALQMLPFTLVLLVRFRA